VAAANGVAAADGVAQERPIPAVGQALLQLASFIEAQHAPKSSKKKKLKPTIKQSTGWMWKTTWTLKSRQLISRCT
jgi:2-methylcitrate dehydratase PrpD